MNYCKDVLFIEILDDFKVPGCHVLLVSSFDQEGLIKIIGLIVAQDALNFQNGLTELHQAVSLEARFVFCEPDLMITQVCIQMFQDSRVLLSKARICEKG